jgi:hypothetical protein
MVQRGMLPAGSLGELYSCIESGWEKVGKAVRISPILIKTIETTLKVLIEVTIYLANLRRILMIRRTVEA